MAAAYSINESINHTRGRFKRAGKYVAAPTQRVGKGFSLIRLDHWLVALYVIALAGTQITLVWDNTVGIYLNMGTLAILVGSALLRERSRKLSISLAILPVVQMLSSTIITTTAFRKATVFYGALLILALVYRYLFTLDEPLEATQLKKRGHAFGIPLMLVLGEVVGLIGYGFLRNRYPYAHTSLPLIATACVIFAFAEEMFLRGLIQREASRIVHPLIAASFTSILYVLLALNHATQLTIGPAVAMGIVLAAVYHTKHNLLLSVTVNAAGKLTYIGLVATFILR